MANDTIRYTLDADTSRFQRAMKEAAKTTSDFEQKVKDLASDLSGHTAQRGMSQLQAAVKQLGGLSGVSSKQIQNLKQQVLSLGAAGAKIPREFAALNKELTNFQKLAKGFGEGIKQGVGVGAGFALATSAASALVSAVKAVPSAIIDAVSNLAKMADNLDTLSLRTGLSTTALQELKLAAERGGTSIDTMTQAVGVLQRNVSKGASVFKELGLSVHALQSMSPEAQFQAVAAAIKGIGDPTRQAAMAMQAFGRAGLSLLPAIKSGISEAAQDAHKFGAVMSGDTLKAAKNLGDQFKNVTLATESLKNQFAAAIVQQPALQDGMKGIADGIGLIAIAVKEAAPQLRLYVELLAKLSGVTSLLQGAAAIQLFAPGPSVKTPHKFGSEAPPGINFGSIDAAAMAAFETNVKNDEKAAKDREAANKKLNDAYRAYFKVLRDIASSFEELRTLDIIGTPGGLGSGFTAMAGMERVPAAPINNALPPGITRQQMDIALGRQAQLDAGASKEASNKIRSAALDAATQSGVDFSKMLGDVAHAFQLLGVGSDSTLGKLLGSLGLAAAAFDQIRAAGGFGNMSASGKIGVGIAGLGVAGAAYKGGSALGGMASGAAFGAAFGPWGAAIGGAVGGILGFLGRGKKKAEEAAKKAEEQKKREAQIQQAAKEMRTQSIDALAGGAASNFFLGRTILTEEDAKRSGTLFMDAWTQVVKEKGVLAAADAFGSAFDKMKADIEAQGIAMPEWMQVISGQMGLSKNEGFRAAATGSQNAAAFLGALGGAGGLSPESFRAFEQEARAQFNAASGAATEAGMETADATKAGFAATNPLLKELVNQSVITGQKLSADIQAMVDAQGIVPDVDIQQLSELQQIRAAVQAMAGQGGGRVIGPAAGDFTRGDFGGEDRIPGFASGGAVTRTGLALVHQGERVLSRDDVKAGGDTYNVTVQASGNKQTDEMLVAKLMDTMGQLVRKGKGRRLTSAMADSGFAVRGRK